MHQSPNKLFKKKLQQHNLSPQKFAEISGMPLTEVKGLLKGRLPFTILRANHLAAVFNTKPGVWLNRQAKSTEKARPVFTED